VVHILSHNVTLPSDSRRPEPIIVLTARVCNKHVRCESTAIHCQVKYTASNNSDTTTATLTRCYTGNSKIIKSRQLLFDMDSSQLLQCSVQLLLSYMCLSIGCVSVKHAIISLHRLISCGASNVSLSSDVLLAGLHVFQ